MSNTTTVPPDAIPRAALRRAAPSPIVRSDVPTLRVVPWVDPVADPHGLHPCSRYVELYWLGVIGPSTMQYEPIGRDQFGLRVSHLPGDVGYPSMSEDPRLSDIGGIALHHKQFVAANNGLACNREAPRPAHILNL
jgi:hypothetical protein